MAFETDADVHFAFIAPETVVGWATNTLIGQPAELLLAKVDGNSAFNPFRPTGPVRNRRAWLRRPDGRSVCMAFSAAPLYDAQGEVVGARGVGQDMSAQDAHAPSSPLRCAGSSCSTTSSGACARRCWRRG